MNQHVVLDASLATGTPERKREVRLLPVWAFILVVAIVAIAALISDRVVDPEQRIQVFQQSGTYLSMQHLHSWLKTDSLVKPKILAQLGYC